MSSRHIAALSALFLLPSAMASAAEFDLPSRVEAVTVFPDGASVTRRFAVEVPAGEHVLVLGDLPLTADPGSLRVAGAGEARLTVGSVDARQPQRFERPDPERVQRLEALRDERLTLDDRIAAERLRKRAAEALVAGPTLAGGERGLDVAQARQAFAAAMEETAAADRAIRQAEQRQRLLDREIASIEAALRQQPPQRLEARIAVEAVAAFRGELTVTYAVRGARWAPVYDARLTTTGAKPALDLIRRAEIRQETGEDWRDVNLTVSTARVARGSAAPQLASMILRFQEPRPGRTSDAMGSGYGAAPPAAMPAPVIAESEQRMRRSATPRPVEEAEAVVDTGGFQASFTIPGQATIASGPGARALRIASATVEPQLISRATPSVDTTAFLQAQFKYAGEVPLMPGRVSLYRDGIFAGRTQLAAATRDETVTIGFGPDDLVSIQHNVVRRTDGSAGIITSSRTEEREFRIVVRNGAQSPRQVVIEDRLPVTEAQDITVEPLPGATAPTARDVKGRRGIIEWAFDLAPGANREIRHGWRLRWPADKQLAPAQGRM
ncbi:mucoidy inhibitor MuiA family protein [Phreatobacter sp. AB_2022a]|uniref:mucoidy inhibitor MuiA family protein n=1 Tax=Phreatobacter sp. AB_2022a TaxID=3003134 RepID=UPI0022876B25|nr:mucoidy inhibitor MuiA family protein [Phreatobacter sp. AB_2022a]MCZ0738599.1 mucoidy inhibitor MuiA family protein [Phreatobacter sp. AB_2022a]